MRPPDSTLDDRAVGDRELDAESAQWLRALGAAGVERDQAAVRLHQLLLRIARNEVRRNFLAIADVVIRESRLFRT